MVWFCAPSGFELRADIVDVFFLAGQSNMSGRVADGFEATPWDDEILYNFVSDGPSQSNRRSEGFTSLGPLDTGFYGPEITIGRRLLAEGYAPVLVKVSDGGPSLADAWNSGDGGRMWRTWVAIARQSLEALEAQGRDIRLRGFFWLQGETDALDPTDADAYGGRFRRFVSDVHWTLTELGWNTEQMRFVTALIRDSPNLPHADLVRRAQVDTMLSMRLGEWFDTDRLETFDRLHYSSASIAIIGEQFVEGFRRSVKPHVRVCLDDQGAIKVEARGVLEQKVGSGPWSVVPGLSPFCQQFVPTSSIEASSPVILFRARSLRETDW